MHLLALLFALAPSQDAAPPQAARIFRGHEADVADAAFSPSGKILATAGFDRTIRLWDVEKGTGIATLSGHAGKVLAVSFSPDGKSLVSCGEDRFLKLWDVPTGEAVPFARHDGPVSSVAVSPDGSLLVSASEDGTVRVFRRIGGRELLRLEGSGGPVRALAIDAAGRRIAAAGDGRVVRVWSVAHLARPPLPPGPGIPVEPVPRGAAWRFLKGDRAPPPDWNRPGLDDSKWMSGDSGFGYSSDAEELETVKTRLDDMPTQQYLTVFLRAAFELPDPSRVRRISLSVLFDDGFVAYLNGQEVGRENMEGNPPRFDQPAAQGTEPSLVEIDLEPHLSRLVKGRNVLAIQGHNSSVQSSDFVLTPALDAVVDPPREEPKEEDPNTDVAALAGSEGTLRAAAFSPDGRSVAAGGDDRTVRVWRTEGGGEILKFGTPSGVRALAFADDTTLAVGGEDGAILIFSLGGGEPPATFEGHRGAVTALARRGDGAQFASSGADGTLRLWDARGRKETRRIPAHEGGTRWVSYGPDGSTVLSAGADGALKVWNVRDGSLRRSLPSGAGVRAAAASPDGRYYSAAGSEIHEWRTGTSEPVQTFSGHAGIIYDAAFSPDGSQVASASGDRTVRFWSAADGRQLRSIDAHASSVYCLAFRPDGGALATAGLDRTVRIWNVRDGSEIAKLEGHDDGVFCLRFSRDGRFLYSGSSDRTLRRWDAVGGAQAGLYEGHPAWVSGLALAPEGDLMYSVDYGGHLLTWDLSSGKVAARRRPGAVSYGVDLSPDGAWIVTANRDGGASLLRAKD